MIINSYKERFGQITDKFENEKDNCKIEINGEMIPFCNYYKFKEKGKHIIKYYFDKNLTKTSYMFSGCKLLNYIDLSN